MENGPFIDGLPINHCDFSMAMLNNQRVYGIFMGFMDLYRNKME
jgi:hypothetical protein